MFERLLDSPEATQKLGARFAELAHPGTVLSLNGPLGAGKTCFAQGVGRGLDIEGPITSPTFILCAVYPDARMPFHHADFYRLGDASELVELGLDEVMGTEGFSLVEWGDRFSDALPADHIRVTLEDVGPTERRLTATAHGPRSLELLERL